MSELGKPPKIARPTARTTGGGVARPAGSASARPAPRPAAAGRQDRPAPAPRSAVARPADLPGAVPVRRPRPRPGSIAPPDMDNQEKSLVGLGNLLKTKREIHGLTRRDVVVKIKIPLEQLEAIEDGRLSSLPPVFAKGFLRAYANELGLDAETILEDYRQMTGGFKNEPASREPLSARYVETSVGAPQGGSRKGLFIVLGVVALLILALAFWTGLRHGLGSAIPFLDKIPGFSADETSNSSDQNQAGVNGGSNPDGLDVVPSPGGPQVEVEDSPFVDDPLRQPLGGGSITGQINVPPPAEPQGGTLILTSQADKVWVEVWVDDAFHEFLLLKAGQKVGWKAERQITVTTGQATSLNVNWNGQDLGAMSGKTVAEVTFPRN